MRETSALAAHSHLLLKSKLLMAIDYILWRILPILYCQFSSLGPLFIKATETIPCLLDHLPTLSKPQEKQWENCSSKLHSLR